MCPKEFPCNLIYLKIQSLQTNQWGAVPTRLYQTGISLPIQPLQSHSSKFSL